MKVMTCTKAEKHPKADKLWVYDFTDETETRQVVANLTNVYVVGDKVRVAVPGDKLADVNGEFEIKETTIRGVPSFGMALGLADDERFRGSDTK